MLDVVLPLVGGVGGPFWITRVLSKEACSDRCSQQACKPMCFPKRCVSILEHAYF